MSQGRGCHSTFFFSPSCSLICTTAKPLCPALHQIHEALTYGSSSETFSWAQTRTRGWSNGKTVLKASSGSWSQKLWLSCGEKRKTIVVWHTRSSAGLWGEPCQVLPMARPRAGAPCSLRLIHFSLTDITTNEKSWNVWMDDGWSISLGRMLVDGEKMRTEATNPWDTNQNTQQMDYDQWRTGRKYFKDYFSVIFMYHEGTKKIYFWQEEGTLQLIKKNFILLLWRSMSYVGNKRTQFSVNYEAVCGWICCCLLVMFFSTPKNSRACSLVLLAKRKG